MIEGARPSEMPGFIKPQLATLKSKAPIGDQWLHEIKYDGYRIQIHLNKGRRKVYTHNGLDWTERFSVIAGASTFPVRRSSTARWWSSRMAGRTSPNSRSSSQRGPGQGERKPRMVEKGATGGGQFDAVHAAAHQLNAGLTFEISDLATKKTAACVAFSRLRASGSPPRRPQ
jgi:hypothetical protein